MTQTPPRPKTESTTGRENLANYAEPKKVEDIWVIEKLKEKKTPFQPIIDLFYNLPIQQKQVTVLIFAQAISILALLGVGVIQIVNSGREQLVNQSASELAAANVNYGIKINQMGFGFRGQSDNPAIIEAALKSLQGQTLRYGLKNEVKQILQNEIQARNIEYATLVGRDRRIIVNANKDRSGELFDPHQLVAQVITNPEQIKTSEIVSAEELNQESPPILPKLKAEENYLIRYTVTPVKNPDNGQLIAVLVSGDLVDGKYSIAEDTIKEFKGGYSAVYKVNEDGSFSLASSLYETLYDKNQQLKDPELLEKAIANPEKIASLRAKIGDHDYTLTGQAILDNSNKPVGVLVRGTRELALAEILKKSLIVQVQVALIIIVINLLLIILLSNLIAKRIETLQSFTKEFAQGKQKVRTKIRGKDEIGTLAATFNQMAENIAEKEETLLQESRQVKFFQKITDSRIVDEEDVNEVLNKSLNEARRLLGLDRIVIYRFNPDWTGYISHESVAPQFPQAINQTIEDPCIPEELRSAYLEGRIVPTEDVLKAGFAPEHLALMERLEIKANLVVSILNQGQLYGLLIGHDCSNTHPWSDREKNFFNQMSLRFGVILDRLGILTAQINAARRSEQLKEITLLITSGLTRQEVLELAVKEIRAAIASDRVIVYEFAGNWQGTIVAESVLAEYPQAIGAQILDPCFAEKYAEKYAQGRVQVTPDIYKAGLTDCHLQQLEPFQVKANLVAPILVRGKLIGLLIAHQCSRMRNWQQGEIELFTQLATQLGLGLERVDLIEAQKQSEEEQRQAKEILQKRALELLMEVDPVSKGDLTIRAKVTEDEIGTIADSYNTTVENLRKIVSQVQSVAKDVAETTNTNESDVSMLKGEIQEQVQNISLALDRIETMSQSISMVAKSARQAEEALEKAQGSVEQGDIAMNRTVKSILEIRSTVQEATSQVKKLGEASEKISNVVNLIGRFAAQTHLLALKASIEAARAGEDGLGFAVIANEVRSLATQSAEATADIEKLVTEIQSETQAVVGAMQQGSQQVVEGTKLVEETRQSLNQVTAATGQINQLVELIATAASEQTENSQEVREKMSDVATVSEKTAVSVHKLADSFQKLLKVAKQLESNVAQFKI
jgi:methyl-accepting chemotaxis protein PixJ